MSVIMTMRATADVDAFQKYASEHPDQLRRIADDAKKQGAKHHMFAATDGELVIIDEWPSAEAFKGFYDSQKEIPQMMRNAGVTSQPKISFANKLDTSDQF